MTDRAEKRDVAISMRLRESDVDMIDRGAELSGMSRTEFMRKAALHDAQLAILNETMIRLTPDAWDQFFAVLDGEPTPAPARMQDRLSRKAPWNKG